MLTTTCDLIQMYLSLLTLLISYYFSVQSSPDNENLTLYYVLVLSSLVLSWVESWVFDVKVSTYPVTATLRVSTVAVFLLLK